MLRASHRRLWTLSTQGVTLLVTLLLVVVGLLLGGAAELVHRDLAGEYEQAKVWGERSIRLNSRSPSTYVQLGYIYANLKDNDNALKSFEQARKLIPKNEAMKGGLEKLDEYIEKLKKGEPLPLPMGESFRTGQKKQDEAPAKKQDEPPAGGK